MASNSRVYSKGVINKKITIPFDKITNDIETILLNRIIKKYEDKCILEGYIKKNSCKILQHSQHTYLLLENKSHIQTLY